ncbi:MAG: protein kinase [Gemmatimonadota bacterium]|nr:protein kinase [Gemmatimonadota bacterium]
MTRAAVAELWERIEPILDSALELPPDSWPAYLDTACGADTALRAAVERLLVSAGNTEAATASDAGAVAWAQPLLTEREPAPPSRIGPYVIDHVLGRGGMGSVYLAARDDAEFAPRVALKVMRSGLDQDRVLLRRFTEERQILATLEHQGVARLLEGGVTGDGHPWFAMEFVDGMPLNRYVEAHELTLTEKLGLFLQICDAVSYAHRNLVVHRDLKPSNILVTADGHIKLLDFGIAKLLAPTSAADAPITRTGFQPFTPEYASPEQVLGEPVTTAADVYALGVVLYELLTGERPLNLARSNPADWARIVREAEPKAPSAVVADRRALRGDLDTIALMALRREPDRRYASVDRLADDVRRHLEQRPVLARADSRIYRARKFVRRQRVGVSIGAIVLIALATFGVVSRQQNANLKRESDRTAAQRDQASAVTHTLWSLLAQLTDSLGKPLSVSEVLDHAEPTIAKQYATQPNVRATMQSALGEIYLTNGEQARAEQLLREAVASQRAYGRDSADLATRLETLGRLLLYSQQYAGAESAGREANAIREKLTPGVLSPEAAGTYGSALMGDEKYHEAELVFRELVEDEKKNGKTAPGTSPFLLLGESLRRQGSNEEAASQFRAELARLAASPATQPEDVAGATSYLASAEALMGHGVVADSLMQRSYALYASAQPMFFRRIGQGVMLANRAELAARTGDDTKAVALADSARALWKGTIPQGDGRWSSLARVDALVLRDHNQPAAAVARLTAALDTLRSQRHPNLYYYRRAEAVLADIFDRWGQPDSAAAHRTLARPGTPITVASTSNGAIGAESLDAPAADSTPLTRAQVVARLDSSSIDHPANFAGQNLSGLDLAGLDFKRANLSHATLVGTKMMKARMFSVHLDGANARNADLSGAILDLATLRSTNFTRATLRDASLYAVIMQKANFTDADLTRVRIIGLATGAIFVRAKLDSADMGADPRNQPMGVMRSDMTEADFSGADLTGANLRKAKLTRAVLTGANLTGADLTLAELSGANFQKIVGRDAIKGLDQAKFRDEATFDPR